MDWSSACPRASSEAALAARTVDCFGMYFVSNVAEHCDRALSPTRRLASPSYRGGKRLVYVFLLAMGFAVHPFNKSIETIETQHRGASKDRPNLDRGPANLSHLDPATVFPIRSA
jgi:hypothetical protein